MKDKPNVVEKLLSGLVPPELPHELQERVLRGARRALAHEAGRDVWTRIWESRPLRVAWALSVVVLAVCHFGITELRSGPASAARQAAQSGRAGNGEVAAIGRLPRLDENARPLIGAGTYLVFEGQGAHDRTSAKGKGKESAS
jgi:hypothetical protein